MALASTISPHMENETSTGTATTRPNPVALEAPVTVTGARPSSEGARDLFTEETRTILVFVDGAVIQLTASVHEGQLLFLTNKKGNVEVVCQVLRKRAFGASACYVELQFTEEKANYWGVVFPKGQNRAAEFTAAEQVAAEKTTEQDGAAPPPTHNEKDVGELKTQVESLRKQLQELEKKGAQVTAAKAALRETGEPNAGTDQAKQGMTSAVDASPEPLLMPAAALEKKAAPGWTVPMALPTQEAEELQPTGRRETEVESLPSPELDFSRVPSTASAEEIAARGSLKNTAPWREKLRMVGLAVVLVAVGLGAYETVAPYWLSIAKKTVGTTGAGAPKVMPAKPAAAKPAPSGTAAVGAATGSSAPAKTNAAETNGAGPDNSVEPGNAPPPNASTERKEPLPATPPPEENAAKNPGGAKERTAKKARPPETAAPAAATEVAAVDVPPTPAKLLHGAAPVYPPDAMRHYITGDVKAELVVEPSGTVGDVKVLSGPKALRDAAVEALKKYQYTPATQGGKAVASKTTEVVKFWFNP